MKNSKPKTRHKQNLVDKAVQYLTREILADRLRPNQRISELARDLLQAVADKGLIDEVLKD